MPGDEDELGFPPRRFRWLPSDLAATAILTTITLVVILIPGLKVTPLRIVFGLPFVVFLPGYAFIAALFPATDDPATADGVRDERGSRTARSINGVERIALSFGLSFAIVPILVLVLNFTPWGIRLPSLLVAVGGFTYVMTLVAGYRRATLPVDQRFRLPLEAVVPGLASGGSSTTPTSETVVNGVLILSLLVALGSVGYAVAVPKSAESFTEFYYLAEDEEGNLGAAEYPSEFVIGEPKPVTVGVSNHEYRPMNYTWVVKLQEVTIADNVTTVIREEELGREQVSLAHNETRHVDFAIQPTFAGSRLRVTFLLYRDAPPANPTVENAYQKTHLWINVTEGE